MSRIRVVTVLVTLGAMVAAASACDLRYAKAGDPCLIQLEEYAQDGTHALKCENGVWVPGLTTEEADDLFEQYFGERPAPNRPEVPVSSVPEGCYPGEDGFALYIGELIYPWRIVDVYFTDDGTCNTSNLAASPTMAYVFVDAATLGEANELCETLHVPGNVTGDAWLLDFIDTGEDLWRCASSPFENILGLHQWQ